jgi:hypothetical protein
MLKDYGQVVVMPIELEGFDIYSQEFDNYLEVMIGQVNMEGSPGVPLYRLGPTNSDILDRHKDGLKIEVKKRIQKLITMDIEYLTAEELVKQGLCDPVRTFIKNEPHGKIKADKKRFRIISSVSLVDQLVERVLTKHINASEIGRWSKIPSKPGMGFAPSQVEDTIKYVEDNIPLPTPSDISGYDWSIKRWNLKFDAEFRIRLHTHEPCSDYKRALRNRWICLGRSVFQLSDGTLIAQMIDGLMKSGCFCTSSTNSHMRVHMGKIAGSSHVMAMGDDAIENFSSEAEAKYNKMGFPMKFYGPPLEGDTFEFCSHIYNTRTRSAFAINIQKETMRLMHRKDLKTVRDKQLALLQYEDDLCGNPYFGKVLAMIEAVGFCNVREEERTNNSK